MAQGNTDKVGNWGLANILIVSSKALYILLFFFKNKQKGEKGGWLNWKIGIDICVHVLLDSVRTYCTAEETLHSGLG